MKSFIVTVDTEGDNIWHYRKGDPITTRNTKYIPRFQELCKKYGVKPVYLTNHEMLCDDEYVKYVRGEEQLGLCEVGLHLHAWNNPPLYELDAKYHGNPYLIEYPDDIMKAKFDYLYNLFCEKIGHTPTSHRAGRWAMDERYFKLLEEYDIKVDCSATPHINWSHAVGETIGGTDYTDAQEVAHMIGNVMEVPLTVIPSRRLLSNTIRRNIKTILKGNMLQLRPATCTLREMKYVVDRCRKNAQIDYLEFMLHSSELMPGGSPYFKSEEAISQMYKDIEALFKYIKDNNFNGVTLKEYYEVRQIP